MVLPIPDQVLPDPSNALAPLAAKQAGAPAMMAMQGGGLNPLAMLAMMQGQQGGMPATNALAAPSAGRGQARSAPVGDWLRYANEGAVRNDPLSPELVQALSFLGDMGITMEVFSGGQENNTTHGTGSTRHNGGNAADVMLYKDGRMLNWANSADLPIYQEIVRQAVANGVTGIGAGPGYMRPGSMHLGFGAPVAWGAGGRSVNAPDWLRTAYYGG